MSEIIHRCPESNETTTPCCGRTPFELPKDDRMTVNPDLVTCTVYDRVAAAVLKAKLANPGFYSRNQILEQLEREKQ